MLENWVQSVDQDDPLEKEMATPIFLPGESHGQRSLEGYSPWGCKESDTTERLHSLINRNKTGSFVVMCVDLESLTE